MKVIVIAVLVGGFIGACFNLNEEQQQKEMIIATTFFPLFDFTRAIVGDNARVVSLIPNGVDPHTYEPSASDLRFLSEADLLVILGVGDGIEEQLLSVAEPEVLVVHAAAGIPLLAAGDGERRDREDRRANGGVDIHVWLSLRNAMAMTSNITEGLIAADIDRASEYQANLMAYAQELSELEEEIAGWLSSCRQEIIVTTHDAYRYFAEEYGFQVVSIHGVEPDVEPSASRLVAIIESARASVVEYVFYEELLDQRIPQIIANEIGATLLPLYPLEYAQSTSDTYLSLMRENGRNVSIALQCQ